MLTGAASSHPACRVPRHTHLGIAKIEIDCFGMSNVQDSIGFWREPGTNLRVGEWEQRMQVRAQTTLKDEPSWGDHNDR